MLSDVQVAAELFERVVSAMSVEQFREPSRLPSWSRGHVVAHVALNAEGFVEVAHALRAGRAALMYPGGVAERDRSIDELAAGSLLELLDRTRAANAGFVEAWSQPPPTGDCATADGHPTFSSSTVLQRRLRELSVHLVDLGLDGIWPEKWTPGFVDADLRLQWPTVEHRTDETVVARDEFGVVWSAGHVVGRVEPMEVDRRRLLAWVLDRCSVDGLPLLEPWSNRSKWEHLEQSE